MGLLLSKFPSSCCCACDAYYFSCHRAATDANSCIIFSLFIAFGGVCAIGSFQILNVPVVFFEFLFTEFAAYSKPPSRHNHLKASYPIWSGCNNVIRVRDEPRSYEQGCRKNEAFIFRPRWHVGSAETHMRILVNNMFFWKPFESAAY